MIPQITANTLLKTTLSLILAALLITVNGISRPSAAQTSRQPASPAAESITILLQPLGDFPVAQLPAIKNDLENFFHAEITILPAISLPAVKTSRGRYRAADLLDYLADRCPENVKIIGFTSADISIAKGANNDWGVFGLGDLSGSAAIVSDYRIKTTGTVRETQLAMIARHELGHTLGLKHCDDHNCLMAAGDNLTTTPINFCAHCAHTIARFLNTNP